MQLQGCGQKHFKKHFYKDIKIRTACHHFQNQLFCIVAGILAEAQTKVGLSERQQSQLESVEEEGLDFELAESKYGSEFNRTMVYQSPPPALG